MIEKIGTLTLGPTVFVSDPSYSLNVWCTGTLTNMLPGTYHAMADIVDEGDWGERVASLTIIHENYLNKVFKFNDIDNVTIGVDSGCAGFFDLNEFSKVKSTEEERKKFFDLCYNATMQKNGDIIRGWGVVSMAGFGDGAYSLKIAFSEDVKNIIAASIDFIEIE